MGLCIPTRVMWIHVVLYLCWDWCAFVVLCCAVDIHVSLFLYTSFLYFAFLYESACNLQLTVAYHATKLKSGEWCIWTFHSGVPEKIHVWPSIKILLLIYSSFICQHHGHCNIMAIAYCILWRLCVLPLGWFCLAMAHLWFLYNNFPLVVNNTCIKKTTLKCAVDLHLKNHPRNNPTPELRLPQN